jgi:arabinofuranosyltransferase
MREPASHRDLWLVGAALLVFGLLAVTLELPAEDDAFIYYRYAWNAAHGHGLVFNVGDADPVEGFSGPSWMGILALAAGAGLDLPRTAPAIGILCGAAILLATWFLARTVGLGPFGTGASLAGLALSYPFVVWSRSGLETPFYSLAIVATVGAYLAAEYPLREELRIRRWVASLALVFVCLGRPEGLLLVPVLVVDRLLDGRDWVGALRVALPAAVAYGGYLVYRLLNFHSLVPNTSVKLYPLLIGRASGQLLDYFVYLGVLPLALPIWALLRRRDGGRPNHRRLALLVSAVLLLSFFFSFAAGGDYRPGFRYLVPTLPLLLVTLWYAFERLDLRSSPWARAVLLVLLLAGPVVLLSENPPRVHGWRQRVFEPWRDPFAAASNRKLPVADWLDRNVPQNGVVAYGQMGRVPYFVARQGHDVRFIDTLGLVDRRISQIYRLDSKLADFWREIRAGKSFDQALEQGRRERAQRVAESILARRPDFILIETILEDYRMMRALSANSQFKATYREVDALLAGGAPGVRIYARQMPSSVPAEVGAPKRGL